MRASAPAAKAAPSQTIVEISSRLALRPRPQLLDLGPICDRTIQYFLGRGCRVFVEAAEELRRLPERLAREAREAAAASAGSGAAGDAAPAPPAPPRLDYPDDSFDGILLWDVMDYLPDELARPFGQELTRVSRAGALLLVYADTRRTPPSEPLHRYKLTEEGAVEHEPVAGAPVKRIYRENRDLFRLFPRFDVRRSTLLRSQVREILLHRLV